MTLASGGSPIFRSIFLLLLVARFLETIDEWRMIVFMSVVMTVWVLWECLLCSLGVLKYGVCLCKG